MAELRIEGYVRDAGDLGLGLKAVGGGKHVGVVIETDDGDVTVLGLAKWQARDLAKQIFKPVTLVLTVSEEAGT